MNRRSFLQSILAAGVAPAFVGSSVLMPVRQIWTPAITFYPSDYPTSFYYEPLPGGGKCGQVLVFDGHTVKWADPV